MPTNFGLQNGGALLELLSNILRLHRQERLGIGEGHQGLQSLVTEPFVTTYLNLARILNHPDRPGDSPESRPRDPRHSHPTPEQLPQEPATATA